MRWIASFTDSAAMQQVRAQLGAAHIAYLAQHKSEIVFAGGCRHDPQGGYVGGLWLLEVATRARAVQLIEQDPYFQSGARSYELRT